MDYETHETIQRLWQRFVRGELKDMPPEARRRVEQEFEQRFGDLLSASASADADDSFIDLVGLGKEGVLPFDDIAYPFIPADFDEAVIPSQLHAAADLYFIMLHEKMKVFKVVDILRRLYREGRIRIQRGPGARGLYLLEKWKPLRYGQKDRMVAYMRVFNYSKAPRPAGAIVNKNFQHQFVALMSSLAQYFRDLTIGEVIRGGQDIEQRPFGNVASIQRLGTDLRYALDRSSYGNIVALAHETGLYLKQVLELLDAPDIKKSFDSNSKWDVVEFVSNRYLGGARDLSQHAQMAESGRRVLQWVADNDFDPAIDPQLFQVASRPAGSHAEAWIAAYRMTHEGRRFPGVNRNLRWSVGLPERAARMENV